MNLNQEQIKRYTRHILLPEIGVEGQKKLFDVNGNKGGTRTYIPLNVNRFQGS